MVPSLLYVCIYLLSSDWKRHLDCQNVSVELLCVYVCLSFKDLFIFLARVSSLFSYFCVINTLVFSLSMCSLHKFSLREYIINSVAVK
jgi:hypothetical protein